MEDTFPEVVVDKEDGTKMAIQVAPSPATVSSQEAHSPPEERKAEAVPAKEPEASKGLVVTFQDLADLKVEMSKCGNIKVSDESAKVTRFTGVIPRKKYSKPILFRMKSFPTILMYYLTKMYYSRSVISTLGFASC